jgi:hypothetical protein
MQHLKNKVSFYNYEQCKILYCSKCLYITNSTKHFMFLVWIVLISVVKWVALCFMHADCMIAVFLNGASHAATEVFRCN